MDASITTRKFGGAHRESAVRLLRSFVQRSGAEEHCDFCAAPLFAAHRHLIEVAKRSILCVCDPCALRFQNTIGGRFRLIPRDPRALPGFQITDAEWEGLALPINLAFFFQESATGKISALYPSPAGATESLLPLSTWTSIRERSRAVEMMEPDTEALLVNRVAGARDYFITPIDACYELAGLIRAYWRGLSGGEVVWAEIAKFFARIRESADPTACNPREACHA